MRPSALFKRSFALVLAVAGGSAGADPVFHFDTGTPPWRGERLELPPGFARDLGWTGVEEIRFSPGMFEAGAPDFFSYILVFHLAPGSDVSESGLKRELLVYYRGLSAAVMGGKGKTVDTSGFSVALTTSKDAAPDAPDAAPSAEAWTGTLDWIEPFATEKAQRLHLEVHVWKEGDHPVVLSLVSPTDPAGEVAWPALREIRKGFRFRP